MGKSKKWEAVGGNIKTSLAVQRAATVLAVGWDHLDLIWCFVGCVPSEVVIGTVLPGARQPGPVFVLTPIRRPSSLFVCLLPALHLTGLSHCKMRKNRSGATVEHFRRSGSPLSTSVLAGREKRNVKRREMGLPYENWVRCVLQALGEIQDRETHRLLMGLVRPHFPGCFSTSGLLARLCPNFWQNALELPARQLFLCPGL